MTMVTDEWKIKKNLLLKCAEPPSPLNKMVVDNITTVTRNCLNDIWIHRSQNISKSFLPFSVQSSHRDCPKSPPPLSPSVKRIVLIRLWFSSILGHYIPFLFLISASFYFSPEMTEYKWWMFCVNKRERQRDLWLLTRSIIYSFKIIFYWFNFKYLFNKINQLIWIFLKICATIWETISFNICLTN